MRLSLRWKIVGGFGLLLVLIAALGWVTVSLFGSLRSVQRKVFDRAIPELVAVDEIVRSFTAQSAAVRGFLISGDERLLNQYQGEVETANLWEGRAEQLFSTASRSDEIASERALLGDLVGTGDEFQELVDDRVVPLAQEGLRTQAFRVLGQQGDPLISSIERAGESLRAQQDALIVRSERELRTRQNQTIVTLAVVTTGALAVGLVLAIVLPRRLVRNLDKLVHAARGIERGDFDQKIVVTSRDEVGELATRFSEMQAGLKRLQQLALQDRELEIAASIQRNLLQRNFPQAPGVLLVPVQRQANRVGGDWYDFEIWGRSLTVAVGDASGKGIAAALMATVALSSLRAERGMGAGPKRVIERANKALLDATDPDSFTTLVYVTLDVKSGEARWFNMGHPQPFLLRGGDGSTGYFIEGPHNRVLGWFDDPGVAETIVTLEPGDRLILFTDGFLEAKDQQGELFGEERLAEALRRLHPLPSETMGDELIGEVERFAAGKLDDDLTMLIVEYRGAGEDA